MCIVKLICDIMRASECINELIKILSQDSSFSGEISELKRKKARIDNDVIRVGVIGVTSSGKSTMLNSLLGEQLLPAEAKPSSSQLVSCRKGPKRMAKIYFTDGRIASVEGAKLTSALVSKYGNENENRANKEKVSQIELISPNLPVASNVELVDSPGLDAYGLDGHEQITMETLLPSVDFCMFVTTCKTNSDEKMRVVLNSIARYRKPVIIIQNMIDSLKESVDGKKSKNDVAKEHVRRIQRVVDKSDIADKSTVHVIQISAKWALNCRMVLLKGKKLNEKGRIYWAGSGFESLEKLLREIPVRLQSRIEYSRLMQVKTEAKRIADQIKAIGTSNPPAVDTHDYAGDYNTLISKISIRKRYIFKSIEDEIGNIECHAICSQRRLDEIKAKHREWTSEVSSIIRLYNEDMRPICRGLGMSERDLRFSFIPSQASALRVHTKTVYKEVEQGGFGGWLKRFVSFGNWGYETVAETQDDWAETTKKTIQFLKNCRSDYSNQLNSWMEKVLRSRTEVADAIKTKNRLNEEARARHLDNEKKMRILGQLQSLIAKMPVSKKEEAVKGGVTHVYEAKRSDFRMPLMNFYSYVHSRNLVRTLHHKSFVHVFGDRNFKVYSWDGESTRLFLSMCANLSNDQISNAMKGAVTRRIQVCNAAHVSGSMNMQNESPVKAILVNLTQPGSAKKQIMDLLAKFSDLRRSRLVFVIQDLEEVITGGDLKNALGDVHEFLEMKLQGIDFSWYAIHSNPVYEVALMEMQTRVLRTQSDEMMLGDDLKRYMERFYDPDAANNISSMMKVFSKK